MDEKNNGKGIGQGVMLVSQTMICCWEKTGCWLSDE
jgi:hypothetical protein